MLPQRSIKVETNVPVKMRDGIVLYADVYRPDTADRYPAVLVRLPYDKSLMAAKSDYFNPLRVTQAGYTIVLQDCRGTGISEGELYPLRSEAEDGYDTVEWVAAQSWCDGKVGMYGGSYFGFTQWAAATTQSPHLKTICPAMFSVVTRGGFICKGGVFELYRMLTWYLMMGAMTLVRKLLSGQLSPETLKSLKQRLFYMVDNIEEECRFLPLKDVPVKLKELGMLPFYSDWLTHIDDNDYWQGLCSPIPLEKVLIPTLQISGWYDPAVSDVLTNYKEMKERGGSELARTNQKVLIGPWIHGPDLLSLIGELDTGIASAGQTIDMTGMHIRWFDYWLKGIDNGIMDEPSVRIFVMGDNIWRDEKEWPLARTRYTKYYFHSGGQANSCLGNGVLNTEPPAMEQPDIYLYDPRNPVPSIGAMDSISAREFGAQDQREVEERTDVLVYTSEPLETDLEVTGPIEIGLWAASSAVDTDFTAKLVDVWPNGKAYNLVQGIVRARYRESVSKPTLLEPGKIYEYSIDLNATSNVFKAGHRIRVQVSSSNFPRWDRNLNTGHPIGRDAEVKTAEQTIYHDKQYPSHIVLPVIPR
jgi:putative CocE/NonD family hydrolase